MRIFFGETFDDGTVGGSHTCMYNLVKYSDRSKYQFTVGFLSSNPIGDKITKLGVDVDILPIYDPVRSGNVIVRKALNWYKLEYQSREYLADYFWRKKIDLVLLNNSIYVSENYIKVCNRLGIPVIVYERGFAKYKKRQIRMSSKIQASVAISDFILENMRNQGFRTKVIRKIYDGIDPGAFQGTYEPSIIKRELSIPESSKVIGIIGNVRPWKGQKYFVEAFQLLARDSGDVYGLIIGSWADEDMGFQRELQETIDSSGLSTRLHFLGFRRDVPRLLSIFDVLVHASVKPEPFGMVLLEAMAARKPVVATNLGGPKEILKNGEYGILVPPRNAEAIAEACRRYLDDKPYSERMIGRAYERCRLNFHIGNTVRGIDSLFQEVSGRND